jgi:CHASE1-domain containing sensor protein
VSAEKRTEFLAEAQKIYPNFQLNELNVDGKIIPAAQRDSYLPLFYVQPIEGNEISIGLDISADKHRRALLFASRDSGEPLAISHVTLVPDTANQSGSVIFLPIYKSNAPIQTMAQRRDAFAGFVMAVYLVGDVLDLAMKTSNHVRLIFESSITLKISMKMPAFYTFYPVKSTKAF